ncbi:MAG: peptidoglycan DD-metalloendopeptidase family protein [Bdellovibrionales bacterium]
MKIIFVLFAVFVFCCAPIPAEAASDDELRKIETQLAKQKRQEKVLAAAALEASRGLDELRQRMIASTRTLQEKEVEQENLEDKLDQLTDEISEKSKTADENRRQLSLMVSVLVDITSRPPESLFLQDKSTADHVHRYLLLQAVLPSLKEKAVNAARDLVSLYNLQKKLAEHKRLVAAAHSNLEKQQRSLDEMIATRQGFLKRTEEQKANIARHLATLAEEASDLRQLMEKVSSPRVKKPILRGDVALTWPVSGAVRKSFGDKDADGVTSEGLTLAAPSGAAVVAPYAGKVVFVGPFRGYGLIMILQHDNGYHTFLSGFGRMDAEMGQDVEAGEPLGVLPVKEGKKAELYFEWRQGDKPVNPVGGLGRRSSIESPKLSKLPTS